MPPKKMLYLMIERPNNQATVDFPSDNVSVELTIDDGQLRIVVRVATDQGFYTWKEQEFTVDCE